MEEYWKPKNHPLLMNVPDSEGVDECIKEMRAAGANDDDIDIWLSKDIYINYTESNSLRHFVKEDIKSRHSSIHSHEISPYDTADLDAKELNAFDAAVEEHLNKKKGSVVEYPLDSLGYSIDGNEVHYLELYKKEVLYSYNTRRRGSCSNYMRVIPFFDVELYKRMEYHVEQIRRLRKLCKGRAGIAQSWRWLAMGLYCSLVTVLSTWAWFIWRPHLVAKNDSPMFLTSFVFFGFAFVLSMLYSWLGDYHDPAYDGDKTSEGDALIHYLLSIPAVIFLGKGKILPVISMVLILGVWGLTALMSFSDASQCREKSKAARLIKPEQLKKECDAYKENEWRIRRHLLLRRIWYRHEYGDKADPNFQQSAIDDIAKLRAELEAECKALVKEAKL